MLFHRITSEDDTDKVVAVVCAAPGWRVATLTQDGANYRIEVRPLKQLGLTAGALNGISGGGMLPFPGAPLVVPLDEAGVPLHSASRAYPPSDERGGKDLLKSYVEYLKQQGIVK